MLGSPHCGGGATPWRGRRHVVSDKSEHATNEQLRRPRRKGDYSPRFDHAQHLGNGDIGSRREHVAKLAHDDVECARIERQVFDVAFVPVDVDSRDTRVLARFREELRREIEARNFRAESCCSDGNDARAAADVEHTVRGPDAGVLDEPCRRCGGDRLQWGEERPACFLDLLERSKWIGSGHRHSDSVYPTSPPWRGTLDVRPAGLTKRE
jgi:hypothetical protein